MKLQKSLMVVFIILAVSCRIPQSGGTFSREGVSFAYSLGWSISEEEELEGGAGYYLSVEKAGLDESGMFTLTWIHGIVDEHAYLESVQEDFKNETLLNNIAFEPVRYTDFSGIPAISSAFDFSTLGIKHTGIMHVFIKGENTFLIIQQEAVEDISENKVGFDLIARTFKVE